jgi:hypothetical protein
METFRQHEFGTRLKRSMSVSGQVVTVYMIIIIIIILSERICGDRRRASGDRVSGDGGNPREAGEYS